MTDLQGNEWFVENYDYDLPLHRGLVATLLIWSLAMWLINVVIIGLLVMKKQFASQQEKLHWKKLRMMLLGQSLTDLLWLSTALYSTIISVAYVYIGHVNCAFAGVMSSLTLQFSLFSIAIISVLRYRSLLHKLEITPGLMVKAYGISFLLCCYQLVYTIMISLDPDVERKQDLNAMGTSCLVEYPVFIDFVVNFQGFILLIVIVYHYYKLGKFLKNIASAAKVAERRNEDTDATLTNLTKLIQWLILTTLFAWFYSLIGYPLLLPTADTPRKLVYFFVASMLFIANAGVTPILYMTFLPSLNLELSMRLAQVKTILLCNRGEVLTTDSRWVQQREDNEQVDGAMHLLETKETKLTVNTTIVPQTPSSGQSLGIITPINTTSTEPSSSAETLPLTTFRSGQSNSNGAPVAV
jgi:hypothetical protein